MVTDVTGMSGLRAEVAANKLSPIDTLEAYSEIVADQDNVFQSQAASMTDTSASSQGLGLISAVNAREDLSEQDAVLAGALAANSLTGPDRAAFGQAAGRQFDDTQLYERLLSPGELTSFNATMNQMAPPATIQANLTKVQDAVEADIPLAAMQQQGLSPATWQLLTSTWSKANYDSATNAAATTLGTDQGLATSAKNRVWVTAGVGLAWPILTLIVSLLLSRSINRRLSTLRRSALTLAEEQLPSVVSRLRRGESVDVAAQAPPLSVGSDEIGQVGQAIDTVRQTAIRSAIDEARVRQGVNYMFRNLARRNQSLLQRQLTVLDETRRRATDPDVLDDLFKMDHLTTRMRRHAEGLIILSGAPPGRSWSAPVKLVDVMRGAVAEVEDYARVTVSTQSRAALAGSAVTDLIHLLAELIENATTLSPPFTQVRVGGETVANGFAIEIEDRGLGMVPQRMQELNERLANPPDINPANTEQLGLFVVGQLARRHGVRVILRPSPYGGTTAVVLIPLAAHCRGRPRGDHVRPRAPEAAGRQRVLQRQPVLRPAAPTPAAATPPAPRVRWRAAPAAPPGRAATGWRAGPWPPPTTTAVRSRPGPATRHPARPTQGATAREARTRAGPRSASPARCANRKAPAPPARPAASARPAATARAPDTARAPAPARPQAGRNQAPGADGTARMTSRS